MRRAAAGGDEPRLAGGMDRQALGPEAGHRRGDGSPAAAGLSPAHRCRHRARARFRHPAGRACRGQEAGADLADGEAALRKLCRARQYSGLHLLLPDALPVLLGESATEQGGGGGRRLHAGACRCPSKGRRHRGHSRRPDRRLRVGEGAQGAWTDLARLDRARAQHPSLPRVRRYPPHGGALGLCAIALFAAAACWEPWRGWC